MSRDRAKRFMDVAVAGTALLALSPLILCIAAAIALREGRPVFYRQDRVGLHGVPFRIWKFRTMRPDADRTGGFRTLKDDPRITPLGRFLRRTSLDELPQLLNVVGGDMSLVGPRPDTPAQEADYTAEDWQARCSVRPGLTGLATVLHKSGPEQRSRIDLDLEYVRTRSLRLDLWILWRTGLAVLRFRNS